MPPSHQRRSRERSLSITPRSPATRAQAARICQVGDQSDAVTSSVALGESLIAFLSSTERSCIISYCSRVTILDDRWISTVHREQRFEHLPPSRGTPRTRSNDQLFFASTHRGAPAKARTIGKTSAGHRSIEGEHCDLARRRRASRMSRQSCWSRHPTPTTKSRSTSSRKTSTSTTASSGFGCR